MTARPAFDPAHLDIAAFAAGRGSLTGAWPLRSLARLSAATLPLADGGEDRIEWQYRCETCDYCQTVFTSYKELAKLNERHRDEDERSQR